MRLLRGRAADSLEDLEPGAVLAHDVRDPSRRQKVALRKGTHLQPADLALLRDLGADDVHAVVPGPGDLLEDDAARRLAGAVAGSGVRPAPPSNGQVSLISRARGWLRVDEAVVGRVNCVEGVMLFTSVAERVADRGDTVGGVKSAPLVLPARAAEDVEALCRSAGAPVVVEPFVERLIAWIAVDRLGETALARAYANLATHVAWLGSRLAPPLVVLANPDSVASAFRQAAASGAFAILVAGASATDPADAAFDGLQQASGQLGQVGVPVEPGTACWTGWLGEQQVLGLASCELFGRPGAVDVLLPRLLLGEPLTRSLLARLGAGGLISSLPLHRTL